MIRAHILVIQFTPNPLRVEIVLVTYVLPLQSAVKLLFRWELCLVESAP